MNDVTRELNRYIQEVVQLMFVESERSLEKELEAFILALPAHQQESCRELLASAGARWTHFIIDTTLRVSTVVHECQRRIEDSMICHKLGDSRRIGS